MATAPFQIAEKNVVCAQCQTNPPVVTVCSNCKSLIFYHTAPKCKDECKIILYHANDICPRCDRGTVGVKQSLM